MLVSSAVESHKRWHLRTSMSVAGPKNVFDNRSTVDRICRVIPFYRARRLRGGHCLFLLAIRVVLSRLLRRGVKSSITSLKHCILKRNPVISVGVAIVKITTHVAK